MNGVTSKYLKLSSTTKHHQTPLTHSEKVKSY